jgi:rhomboid protease GluP
MTNGDPGKPPGPPPPHADAHAPLRAEFARLLQTLTPRTWVVPAIVVINLGVFAVMVASGVHIMNPTAQSLVDWGANFGPRTTGGEWWRLLTCTFVHIGILHVLLNMWAFWDAGRLVERLVGNAAFIALYLLSGVAGSLVSLYWNPLQVSAGASGAVFGVYGALIGFLALRRGSIPAPVLSALGRSALVFIGYNLVYGFIEKGIDVAAHLGGLGFGFLCGLGLSQPLSTEASGRRGLRAALVATCGSLAITAGIFLVPKGPGELGRELEAFERVEVSAVKAYNDAVGRMKRREITPEAMADVIEKEMLPPWRVSEKRLEALGTLPGVLEKQRQKVLGYIRKRGEAWALMAKALRANDVALLREAMANDQAVEREIKEKAPGSP